MTSSNRFHIFGASVALLFCLVLALTGCGDKPAAAVNCGGAGQGSVVAGEIHEAAAASAERAARAAAVDRGVDLQFADVQARVGRVQIVRRVCEIERTGDGCAGC